MNDNKSIVTATSIKGITHESQTNDEEAFLNRVMQLMSKSFYDWEHSRTSKEKDG